MFYDLTKLCLDLGVRSTFNEGNKDKAHFDTWVWRKRLINLVSLCYHNPKLVQFSPLVKEIESKTKGLKVDLTLDSKGRITLMEVSHENKRVNFKFKR